MAKPLLKVVDLHTYLYTRYGVVKAVNGVSFTLNEGETLGLIGESGCGKTMTGLSLLRLVPQPVGKIVKGQVFLDGEDTLAMDNSEFRKLRGSKMSMVLQDPLTSLNPVFNVGDQVGEPLRIHQGVDRKTVWNRAVELLRLVRIPAPESRVRNYPHHMSGGMRQRVVSAIALALTPRLLIADEPTTSLDVTTQLQILELLKDLQHNFGMSMIWITHDFGIVRRVCDRIAVMYAGKIVEIAPIGVIFEKPRHPYTIALFNSVARIDRKVDRLYSIDGQPPDLRNLPPGCPFAARCSEVMDICRTEYPPETLLDDKHSVFCWKVHQSNTPVEIVPKAPKRTKDPQPSAK